MQEGEEAGHTVQGPAGEAGHVVESSNKQPLNVFVFLGRTPIFFAFHHGFMVSKLRCSNI